MPKMSFREGLRLAMTEALDRDERVVLMGEDIGPYGGAFKVTEGLYERYGADRVIETPISENGFAGVGVGAAMTGLRPVVEFMFMDFMALAMDQICNHAAKFSYMYAGQCQVPVVFRAPFGGGYGYGASHSQSLEAWFMHTPGLRVVVPSTPAAARGLLDAAIRDNGPVVFLEHKALYNLVGNVSDSSKDWSLDEAQVVRRGRDVTVVGYGRTAWLALEASRRLRDRIDVEVIDLRSLVPMDVGTLVESVSKTRRVVVVEDDCLTGGVGAEVSAAIAERVSLAVPLARVACADVPMPCCDSLERAALPSVDKVLTAVARQMEMEDALVDRGAESGCQREPRQGRQLAGA